jgi:hypothetical protein
LRRGVRAPIAQLLGLLILPRAARNSGRKNVPNSSATQQPPGTQAASFLRLASRNRFLVCDCCSH